MPAGRPRLPFDKEQFEEMCAIQCTEAEIAAVLKMSVDTLARRVEEEYGLKFAEIFAQKREAGKKSLRRAQWATALEAKNPIMQIFLGKNMLAQADKQEIDLSLSGVEIVVGLPKPEE